MKLIFTILALITTTVYSFAQQGTLKGRVTDNTTGEAVMGAVVFIKGTAKGTATDYEGNYSLSLEPGTHTVSATFLSYKPSENIGITIKPGQTTTLDIQLEDNSTELNVVEVVATRQTNTDLALLQDLKQSEIVVSGVSGEQIAKSMDRDAAAVVRRIPGVTVMNDRYIMIRGLSERYNTVMLNGALAPSTETDSRAFSFDILPTSVLDRILVFKSGSPELPGEFGGGVIKVFTKNSSPENSTTLGITTGIRSGTTFNNITSGRESKTDLLGFDNGFRSLPGSFPAHLENSNSEGQISAAKQLSSDWSVNKNIAMPDKRLSFGLTRRFFIGDTETSNLTTISYSNTSQVLEANRYRYTAMNEQQQSAIEYSYKDVESSRNARVGVISNWAFRLNNNHKVEFRNLFNQLGQSEVIERTGQEVQGKDVDVRNISQRYESRTIYSGQLQGTHDSDNITYTWSAGYNYTNRNEPNYRRIRSQRNIGSNEPFKWVIPYAASTFDAGTFFSKMTENTVMASAEALKTFTGKDTTVATQPKLRAGFYAERKARDFDARWMSYAYADPSQFDESLLTLPLGELFKPEQINSAGFKLKEGTNPTDRYLAQNTLVAGYIGGTLPLDKLNLAGGVRVEYNRQQLQSAEYGRGELKVDNPLTHILPSLNATYNFSEQSLLRGGYSLSVNRAEFRELAPFAYYDFQLNAEIKGNKELTTATIHNTDLRYEFYPNPTELLSIGAFYKYFKNPIELYSLQTGGNAIYQPNNAASAQSYGIETEIRKSFLNLSNRALIQNMSLVLNASLIQSKVDLGNNSAAAGQDKERPMYGQSPYIVNAGLYYQEEDLDLQVNLLYNVIGKRIFTVGDDSNPTVYEMPRNVLDLSVTKGIGKHFELKAGIQDILNQKTRLIQDSDRNATISNADKDFTTYKRGSYTSVGINYTF